VQVVIHQPDADPELKDANHAVQLGALCRTLGVTILLKGQFDLISDGKFTIQVDEEGSPRRCGGQGDVLAGALAVTSHWSLLSSATQGQGEFPDYPPQLWAGVLASAVTRRAAQSAFSLKKRSTTTPDIIAELGAAFESLIPFQL
jgi:ATP-dependent NAD(P)H-hydrate dehydratase